jgi:hypothetical protein
MQVRVKSNSDNCEEVSCQTGHIEGTWKAKKKIWISKELESPRNTNSITTEWFAPFYGPFGRFIFILPKRKKRDNSY